MKITLPWLDMSLMPNRRGGRHWASTQSAKVRARQDGYYAAKEALGRAGVVLGDGDIELHITYAAPDARHRDLDNLLAASKPMIDGVAQALGVDDRQFRPITINATRDARKVGYVTVEIGV